MSRSVAREIAFKLIFEYVFNKEEDNELLSEYLDENSAEAGYIQNVYHGVISHYDELCGIVKDKSVGFSFDRIFKVDLAILLVALYEIKYVESIPTKVSINEALNLAKAYSTEKSNKFINGILASVV
ncbi:MAG: transcription antitermination factor NusB [Clostridia bacterium]|nr:transcription antitermination factor NusB [Clostridia bacterium]